jgi:thioredoxin 1
MALVITDSNFKEVLEGGKPIVLDFSATWCGPCRQVAPIIEEIAQEYDGKVVVGKCDIDENSELPANYSVRNIPTILFIKDGKVIDKHVGATTKSVLLEKLKEIL